MNNTGKSIDKRRNIPRPSTIHNCLIIINWPTIFNQWFSKAKPLQKAVPQEMRQMCCLWKRPNSSHVERTWDPAVLQCKSCPNDNLCAFFKEIFLIYVLFFKGSLWEDTRLNWISLLLTNMNWIDKFEYAKFL